MQPIHTAAVSGMIDVVHHLITKYKVDPRCTAQVPYSYYVLSCSCCVVLTLCSIQDGMQAIHLAADKGHPELMISLIDKFGIQPQEKADEASLYSIECSNTTYSTTNPCSLTCNHYTVLQCMVNWK